MGSESTDEGNMGLESDVAAQRQIESRNQNFTGQLTV